MAPVLKGDLERVLGMQDVEMRNGPVDVEGSLDQRLECSHQHIRC